MCESDILIIVGGGLQALLAHLLQVFSSFGAFNCVLILTLCQGAFGPIATAFSICALAQPWREYIPDGSSEDQGIHLPDPSWYAI
jgi:hypothetical protein